MRFYKDGQVVTKAVKCPPGVQLRRLVSTFLQMNEAPLPSKIPENTQQQFIRPRTNLKLTKGFTIVKVNHSSAC